MIFRIVSIALALFVSVMTSVEANSDLPVPRFVSFASNEVNLRTGPGTRYPIQWVYTKKDLPVEIINEFDTWRKIRDIQGDEGWVHQTMVTGYRHGIIRDDEHNIMAKPEETASIIARLEPGVIVEIETCGTHWCEVEALGYDGWIEKSALWGVYPQEIFD